MHVIEEFLHLEPFKPLRGKARGRDSQRLLRMIAKGLRTWLPEDPDDLPDGLALRGQELALVRRLAANVADGVNDPLKALFRSPLEGYSGELWRPKPDTARRWRTTALRELTSFLLANPHSALIGSHQAEAPQRRGRRAPEVPEPDPLSSLRAFLGVDAQLLWEGSRPAVADVPHWNTARMALDPQYGLDDDPSELPLFVTRDGQEELNDCLTGSRDGRRIVLLVGDPGTGKTRMLFEAIFDAFSAGPVLAPLDGALVNRLATAEFLIPRIVLWLDEFQCFLPGPYARTDRECVNENALTRLLTGQRSVVVVGTMLSEFYATIDSSRGGDNVELGPGCRILRNYCRYLKVNSFSPSERAKALRLSKQDLRLYRVLADPDWNVTEFLAGGNSICKRFESPLPHEKEVLLAAIDLRRIGIKSGVSRNLLERAAVCYVDRQRMVDRRGISRAVEAAVHPQGTSSALLVMSRPDADTEHFAVSDLLYQYVVHQRTLDRRYWSLVPESLWTVLVERATSHAAHLAARAASDRLLYSSALQLYLRCPDSPHAAQCAAQLLARADNAEALRQMSSDGNHCADYWLICIALTKNDTAAAKDVLDRLLGRDAGAFADTAFVRISREAPVDMLLASLDANDTRPTQLLATKLDLDRRKSAVETLKACGLYPPSERPLLSRLPGRGKFGSGRHERGRTRRSYQQLGSGSGADKRYSFYADVRFTTDYKYESFTAKGVADALHFLSDSGESWATDSLARLLVSFDRTDEALSLILDDARFAVDEDRAGLLADLGLAKPEVRRRLAVHESDRKSVPPPLSAELLLGIPLSGADVGRLCRLVAGAGVDESRQNLTSLLADLSPSLHERLRRFGLRPDGSISDGWQPVPTFFEPDRKGQEPLT